MRIGGTYMDHSPVTVQRQKDETDDLLTDEEVKEISYKLKELQDTYFQDVPLNRDQHREFIYNIPRRVLHEMHVVEYRNLPDILSPLFLLYPIFTEIGGEAQGVVLSIIQNQIEEHADVINEDIREWKMSCIEEEENG